MDGKLPTSLRELTTDTTESPCSGAETETRRSPSPADLIPHHKPAMKPRLYRNEDWIALMVMDRAGFCSCLVMTEKDVAELILSGTIILGAFAHDRMMGRL